MKKLATILSVLSLILSITACSNSFAHIDRDDVESVIIQYSDSRQYFLSAEEMDNCIELYNAPESTAKCEGEETDSTYQVVIMSTNGDFVRLNRVADSTYDFYAIERINSKFFKYPTTTYEITNPELTAFFEGLLVEKFAIE